MAASLVDAAPKHAFAYDGGAIVLTDEHTTLSQCGNLLKFSSIVSNSQHFLTRTKPTRISAFDGNAKAAHVALAACEEHAEISIYSAPEKKLRGKLKARDSLVFEHYLLKFSRCGSRLLSVGTTPTSNELRVWDVDKFDAIDGCDAALPTRVAFASFNPLDSQSFVTAAADSVTFWRVCHGAHGRCCLTKVDGVAWGGLESLGKSKSGTVLVASADDGQPGFSEDGADDDDAATRYRYVSHCWAKTPGHVYLVNQRSELVTLDSATGALVSRIVPLSRPPVVATALALTAESLVVGFSDGTIRWLASDDLTLVLQTTALPQPVTTLALSPACVTLVAGTMKGGQYELKAYVDSFEDDGQNERQQQATATPLGMSHTGAIVAVTTLLPAGGTTNDAALVSGGVSGLLHVWTVVGCRGVVAVDLADLFDPSSSVAPSSSLFSPSSSSAATPNDGSGRGGAVPIVSLAARYLDPIVLIGDAVGRLRIVGLSKSASASAVDVAPLHTVRLFPASSPIDLVELHPSLPLVLVASSADSAVFVVSLEPDKQFRVVAFVRTTHRPQLVKWVPTSSLESTYFLVSTAAAAPPAAASAIGYVLVPNSLDDRMATELPVVPLGADATLPLDCHGGAFLLTPGKLLAYFNRGDKALHLVKVYDAPGAAKDRELKTLVLHAHAKPITAIARSILSSKDGQEIVATGGADGVVSIWLVQTKRSSSAVFLKDVEIDVRKQRSLPVHAGPVTALVFATCDDYLYVYSTGADGAIFCIDVHLDAALVMFKSVAEGASPLYAAIVGKDRQAAAASEKKLRLVLSDDPKPFLDTFAEEQAALVRAKYEAVKDAIRGPLAEIQLKLKTMLQHNAELPDTEALDRHEFVINKSQEADLLAQSDTRAKEVRRNITRQIAELDIVRDRMRVEFWDSGDVHGVQLHGLHSSLHVVNLPVRKLGKAEVRRFDTILRLREIEFHAAVAEPTSTKQHSLHRRTSSMYHHGEIIPPNISWMVNAGLLHPSLGKKLGVADMAAAAAAGATKGGVAPPAANQAKAVDVPDAAAAADGSSDDGPTAGTIRLVDLIYHPAMIRTRKQQRTQIHLLQAYERHLIMQYNAEFDALVKLKEAKIDEIEGKNTRMREICAELGVDAASVTVVHKWHPDEIADSMMRLLPGEATKVPYETDDRRKVREAAEAAARLQEEKNKKDDVAGRALSDMMNGTLETKKETIVAQTVAREAWMDEVPADDMTAEQKQKVAAFEAEALRLLDEKEKARKALDLELKKLKVDVTDVCKAFDDKLKCLHDLYLATRMSVLTQQMYILRLGEVLMDHEHCCHEKAQLQNEIDAVTADIQKLQADVAQFAAQMDDCRDAWQRAVDDDKACERAFPKEIEDAAGGTPLEHDVMRTLLELYRKRRPQTDDAKDDSKAKGGRKDGTGSTRALGSTTNLGDVGNLDPFSHADRRKAHPNKAAEAKRLLPLDPDVDRPESIATDSAVWTVLNECRVKKMTLEQVVKRKNDLYVEAKDVVEATQAKVAALEDKADRYSRALQELVDTMDLNSDNHPILVKIKQGQDEASGDDLVTLFEETESALLIARRSVESLNATIMVHGNDQVAILGKIKNFRKNINLMEWEHAYLDMQKRNTEDHYTDLQLLRVTKNLQELITTGDASEKQKQEQVLLESKLAYMGKSHQVHHLKQSKTTQALKSQLADRLKENEQFKRQLQDLQTHIHIREDIVASRRASAAATSSGAKKGASHNPGKDNKLKAITVRRKLVDLAKAQSEEIEFMRQELDKIRRRTFPSFVQPMQAPGDDDDDFFRD